MKNPAKFNILKSPKTLTNTSTNCVPTPFAPTLHPNVQAQFPWLFSHSHIENRNVHSMQMAGAQPIITLYYLANIDESGSFLESRQQDAIWFTAKSQADTRL